MSVATDSMGGGQMGGMGRVGATATKKLGVHSLVISPDLDALLEHDERMRRAASGMHGGTGSWSSSELFGAGPTSPNLGLPPPPRRMTRVPSSPLSPPPRSPLTIQQQEKQATPPGSLKSVDSNPYINPAPQFVVVDEEEQQRGPISPPPRTSSMWVDQSRVRGASVSSAGSGAGSGRGDRPRQSNSPSSSGTSSPADCRFPPQNSSRLYQSPSLSRVDRLLKRSPKDTTAKDRDASRSRGKLVKPHSPSSSPSSPQMSEIVDTRRRPSRRRSSISVSTPRQPLYRRLPLSFQPALAPKAAHPDYPKPDFRRRADPVRRPSPAAGPPAVPVRAVPPDTMPPTTNFLNPTERAQLIKKSRKLAQVFGQTPGAADFLPDSRASFLDVQAPSTSKSHHRPAASMNMVGQMPPSQRPLPPWPAPEKTIHMTINGRRHSTPTIVSDEAPASTETNSDEGPHSPHSFMDFSNEGSAEVGPDDSISVADTTTAPSARPRLPASPSSPSLFENLTPEEQAEEERRKKRDKLAKVHRFLGSRVPANLVLGPDYIDALLSPPVVALDGTLAMEASSDIRSRPWVKRRRSSSAAPRSTWSDDYDRVKEDLNDKEKAIIVRRAQKMEKVFGVAPPQKLYNAHHAHSPTASGSGSGSGARTVPASPARTPPTSPVIVYERNPNQTPYKRKSSARKSSRPDSSQGLLSDAEPTAGSFVYTHYQHSLNSLHDILDRNDKESLVELHQYLNDASADAPPLTPSRPTLTKAERRRSLPARTSLVSLASIASASSLASLTSDATAALPAGSTASTPDADKSEFQQRRRRAAKLTQFFGVDYRDLIDDVLDSIEHGLDAERSRGTLNTAEAEDLLQKLRTLKTRRA